LVVGLGQGEEGRFETILLLVSLLTDLSDPQSKINLCLMWTEEHFRCVSLVSPGWCEVCRRHPR
jgi:hypothetical protein